MKTRILALSTLILMMASSALACLGGDRTELKKDSQILAVANKTSKSIVLAEGSKLVYIGNCRHDNVEQDLSVQEISVGHYVQARENICLGLQFQDKVIAFEISHFEMNRITRGGCGGSVQGQEQSFPTLE